MTTLTDHEAAVLNWTARLGATTMRNIVAQFGPMLTWRGLFEKKLLRTYATIYGEVVAITPAARDFHPKAHYLIGPSSVVDRAYQVDALYKLQDLGYKLYRAESKVASPAIRKSEMQRKPETNIFTRFAMTAPNRDELIEEWSFKGKHHESLGRPYAYASISGGGIKLSRLKQLLHTHRHDIDDWRSPLLIAVPDDTHLRPYLRQVEAEWRRSNEALESDRHLTTVSVKSHYDRVRLVIVPLPSK